jgi:hypothetical protein
MNRRRPRLSIPGQDGVVMHLLLVVAILAAAWVFLGPRP